MNADHKAIGPAPRRALVLGLALLAVVGCERGPTLETRTFRLQHLRYGEAALLLEPYVYADRETHPGSYSELEGAITVRETRDNLSRIERVLADFDRPRPDVQLRFQLIEAGDFETGDSPIAEVEDELRRIFPFTGYRLVGEAAIASADRGAVMQRLGTPSGAFQITASVRRQSAEATHLDDVTLWDPDGEPILQTSVDVDRGQTVVLGSSPGTGSTATLFLAVRAEGSADTIRGPR